MQTLVKAQFEVQRSRSQLNKHFLQDNKPIEKLGHLEKLQYFKWIIGYGKKLTSFIAKFPLACSSSNYSETAFLELFEWYSSWKKKDEKEREAIEKEALNQKKETAETEVSSQNNKVEEFSKGGVFSKLSIDRRKWTEKSRRTFTQEEINEVDHATVVESNFGSSVCFFMKAGGNHYIPLDQNSNLGIGENVDLNKAELVTLCKQGEADIIRVSM